MRRWFTRFTAHSELFALFSVGVATALFHLSRLYFAPRQWAIFYLLLITLIARVSSTRAAIVAAVLSFLAWDYYFIEPFRSVIPADPKDWIGLLGFLFVGIIIGVQTGHLREREETALARARETALLNRLSASMVSISSTQEMVDTILQSICDSMDIHEAILFRDDQGSDGLIPWKLPAKQNIPIDREILARASWVVEHRQIIGLPSQPPPPKWLEHSWPLSGSGLETAVQARSNDLYLPLQTISTLEGVLYIAEHGEGSGYNAHEITLLTAAANLIASFLERQRLETAAYVGENVREMDRFKSILISSVSHELKTPLAAINATVTNLLANDVNWNPAMMAEELETIRSAGVRLSDNINALVDLSRLQADAWKPNKDWYELEEIIGGVVKVFPKAQRARLSYQVPEGLPQLYVDFHQFTRVFHHLLENAFSYAPDASPIHVCAEDVAGELRIRVEDTGPGVPPAEHSRIFEKFYRGAAAKTAPTGTGLGLAITDEIVRAHGGRIWVEDIPPHGARFIIALPHETKEPV